MKVYLLRRAKACRPATIRSASGHPPEQHVQSRFEGPFGCIAALHARTWRAEPAPQSSNDLKIRHALVPPNPNEFDMARRIRRPRALSGTKTSWQSGAGSTRLMVGGPTEVSIAFRHTPDSTAPAAPSRCPIMLFVELTQSFLSVA